MRTSRSYKAANGLLSVVVTWGALPACTPFFDTSFDGFDQGLADGGLGLDGATRGLEDCTIVSVPDIGEWTPRFTPDLGCECSSSRPLCHSLFDGRVVEITGVRAVLEFRKTDTLAGPASSVSYWLVDAPEHPSCAALDTYEAAAYGTWPLGIAPLIVSVDLWTDVDAFRNADDEAEIRLSLVTGGQGFEHYRLWWQPTPITFRKECR